MRLSAEQPSVRKRSFGIAIINLGSMHTVMFFSQCLMAIVASQEPANEAPAIVCKAPAETDELLSNECYY